LQTLSIIPQRHGGRVNRAIFIDEPRRGVRAPRTLPPPLLPVRRVAIFLVFSKDFLSISRRDRKAHPTVRQRSFFQHHWRIAPPTHTRFPLYGALRRCRDSDEYSLKGFITSIYVRVSNSYPRRSTGTIEPTNVYPTTVSRIPVDGTFRERHFPISPRFSHYFRFFSKRKKIFNCIAAREVFYILSLQYETVSIIVDCVTKKLYISKFLFLERLKCILIFSIETCIFICKKKSSTIA